MEAIPAFPRVSKMARSAGMAFLLVALLAASANARSLQQTRELQDFDLSKLDLSKLPTLPALGLMPPGVELPPLSEFLPPLDSINLPPLNEFLKSVGLPSWEEMNLPPLSEFMKPVFDPQKVELPSINDVWKQANETFVATVKGILKDVPLPPGVKIPNLRLPPLEEVVTQFNLTKVNIPKIDLDKLPKMPSLDQLVNGLNALQSGDLVKLAAIANITVPKNLPPLNEVMTALGPIADFVNKLPNMDLSKLDINALLAGGQLNLDGLKDIAKALPPMPAGLPPLDEIVKGVGQLLMAKPAAAAAHPATRKLLEIAQQLEQVQ